MADKLVKCWWDLQGTNVSADCLTIPHPLDCATQHLLHYDTLRQKTILGKSEEEKHFVSRAEKVTFRHQQRQHLAEKRPKKRATGIMSSVSDLSPQGPKSKATRKNLGIIRKKHARDEWKDSLWLQQQYFSNLVVKLLCPVRFSVAVMPWTQSLAPLRHEISLIVGFARCSCNIHPWTLDSEMLHSGILRDCTCLFRHGTVMEMLRHLTKCKVSKGFFFFRTSSPFLHSI